MGQIIFRTEVWIIIAAGALLILVAALIVLTGCMKATPAAATYKVDYSGEKGLYAGAKDSYKAGDEVELSYGFIATDTDYTFLLDGEPINVGYDEERGFIIRFTMPEHDVKLECRSKNSMVYVPDYPENVMLIDYYAATVGTDGGDSHRELVLSTTNDPEKLLLEVFEQSGDGAESRVRYSAPYSAAEDCFDVIYSNNMAGWKDIDDPYVIDGALTVVKYRDEYGGYVRVSTEQMPRDGEAALGAVGAALSRYLSADALISDAD